jgi:hypothetical protein
MPRSNAWDLKNLAGGMDRRRDDAITPNTQHLALDVRFQDGGLAINRPPLRRAAAAFSLTTAQGLHGPFLVKNRLVAINTSGSAVTVPAEIQDVLVPTGIESTALGRQYLDHAVLGGDVLCVLLARETAVANHRRIELHVFDQAGDLGTLVCGFGMPWAAWDLDLTAAWRPKLGTAGGSLVLSGPDGNVYRSAVGNPRVWWDLDSEDQYDDGWEYLYYFSGHASELLVLPIDQARMVQFDTSGNTGFNGFKVTITKPDHSVVVVEDGSPALGARANGGASPTFTNWATLAKISTHTGLYRVQVFPPRPGSKRGRYHTVGNQAFKSYASTTIETWVATAGQRVFDVTGSKLWFNAANRKHMTVLVNGAAIADSDWDVSGSEKRDLGDDYAEWGTQIKRTTDASAGDVVELRHLGHLSFKSAGTVYSIVSEPCLVIAEGKTHVHKGGTLSFTGTTQPARAIELALGADGYWALTYRELPDLWHCVGYTSRVLLGIMEVGIYHAHAHPSSQTWEESIWAICAMQSGRDDAGMLPTGRTASGSAVTGLVGVSNRLLVTWADSMALWAVNEDSGTDRFLGDAKYGTGSHAYPLGVEVDGQTLVPVTAGLAAITLGNQLADRLRSSVVSAEVIAERDSEDERMHFTGAGVVGVAWWSDMTSMVLAANMVADGVTGMWFLVRQELSKAAWILWSGCAAASFVTGSLVAKGRRLYWREETAGVSRLAWLDMEPADSDQRDESTTPIVGVLRFNHLSSGNNHFKVYDSMDVGLKRGTCSLRFQMGASRAWRAGPTISRNTYQSQPIPTPFGDVTVAPELTLTGGAAGFRVDAIGFAYRIHRRGV